MEAIVIHPDSAEQLKIVKAVLKALNVRFEKQASLPQHLAVISDLPDWQKEVLDNRLESARTNPKRIRPGDELLKEL